MAPYDGLHRSNFLGALMSEWNLRSAVTPEMNRDIQIIVRYTDVESDIYLRGRLERHPQTNQFRFMVFVAGQYVVDRTAWYNSIMWRYVG